MFILLLINTFLGALGALFIKTSTSKNHANHISLFFSREFILGSLLYGFAIIMNIFLLQYMDYLIFISSLSLTYIWTLFLSKIFLHESITKKKLVATVFISIGIILISL